MRIAVAALTALLVDLYYLIIYGSLFTRAPLDYLHDPALLKDITLAILALYLTFEGVLLIRRNVKTKPVGPSAEQLAAERERIQLETAYAEAKERLRSLETTLQARERPAAIDAELVNMLAMFQDKGRLVDFLMDDITPYSDAQVGAAARVVHQGCSGLLRECFSLAPVDARAEGDSVVLAPGFNSKQYRLAGQVSGQAPYCGTLLHRGWQTSAVDVPRLSTKEENSAPWIVAPAEVEI